MNILLISGSFRSGSHNQVLLDETRQLLAGHEVHQARIDHLPFYDAALDGEKRPPAVREFIQAVTSADAIIIATPEFNHSIPAVLKNALDWASRPAFQSPLKGKPVTVLSASPSPHGGNLLQAHLKQVLDSMLCHIYPAVSYCLGNSGEKIRDGRLVDEQGLQRLQRHISGFSHWAGQQQSLAAPAGH